MGKLTKYSREESLLTMQNSKNFNNRNLIHLAVSPNIET